jgi:hypothetical protein
MSTRLRLFQTAVVSAALLAGLFFSSTCRESAQSPTAPGNATVTGNVVSGDGPSGTSSLGSALAGVMVRVSRTGQSTQTDGSGEFTLANVPGGDQELSFSRSDIDARGTLSIAGANVAITATIRGRSTVVITPRGNPPGTTTTPHGNTVEEIEGLVSAVGASSLTVFDQRLGSVVVNVTGTTVIRKGETPVALADILVGMRVHVKATAETNGTFTAIEIIVQNENTKTFTPGAPKSTATPTRTTTPTATPTP